MRSERKDGPSQSSGKPKSLLRRAPGVDPHRVRTLVASLVVAVALGATAWHAAAHEGLGRPLAGWQTTYTVAFGVVGPFGALVLLWLRRAAGGALLLGFTSLLSIGYDLVSHYVLDGPESIAAVPDAEWSRAYRLTAMLLIIAFSVALWVASWILRAAPEAQLNRRSRRRHQG